MVNFNGTLIEPNVRFLDHRNRGMRFGDALTEEMRVLGGHIAFWEDHYFRLMSSMRIMRMEIPMEFTMEYLEAQVAATLDANNVQNGNAILRLMVFRKGEGAYVPGSREISWYMETEDLETPYYILDEKPFKIELFKDFLISEDLLSTLRTNNNALYVTAGIFSAENGYDSCLLLNHRKMVVEALHGNLFLLQGKHLKTPPLSDGCTNGIIRKKIVEITGKIEGYTIEESPVSPFDLQKADELFLTGTRIGIRPVTHYRKASYATDMARQLIGRLNALARLH